MKNEQQQSPAEFREKARLGLRQGDQALAERSYERLLETDPDDLEALQQLASISLARAEASRAIELLTRAHQASPEEPFTLHQLALARMTDGDMQGAVNDLRRGLELKPDMFLARLRLGALLDELGQTHEALVATFNALNTAQAKGRWLNDETTAPELRDAVKRATQFVLAGRRSLFNDILEPLRQRYGASELVRVEQCLAIYLGEQKATLPDSRQQPKFLYFPGVPSQPYYPRERFPWQAELEAHTAAIREELLSVLLQPQDFEPFLQTDSPQDTADLLRSSSAQQAAWDAYFFYRHGERYDAHAARCPQTAALLDALPLARVREHSPETLYSVLRPGTHILPHRGVTNTRLVTHLPLIVPSDCALRVGGEVHEWKEGRCVTFDDTYTHEAWNNSAETRVVLILDTWNPDLSEAERAAVADLVGAIGDFNRASEVPVPKG
ncbi:aspartyl/asparaginyl beta-hydroxylase domain-containing protein [Rhodanobacter sp. MP7CTX1]|uniref:aspartyl/asparaginyl beta-hydroxylase domain-containing protein n=1 Tax=Rhodanobacter sp. MP7CTX1 TaxID=2723084 RepID=UPI001607AB01|nr:aspartyl/asparaginyl beta-hydroxylase domain-containing protein [Rhodanobacter sp. MP7CTX1]MBB6189599.1 aspartate beta-hydroxylase [Rhodanobacter sp. MP7CTX1]